MAGVSQEMFTQTLRAPGARRPVLRTMTPTVPVTVTYELIDLGLSLHRALLSVRGPDGPQVWTSSQRERLPALVSTAASTRWTCSPSRNDGVGP